MAEKEITIKITTDADTSQIQSLKTAIEELQSSSDNASNSVDNLNNATSSIDSTTVTQASSDADGLANSTSQADSEVQNLSNSFGLLDSAVMLDLANQMGQFGSQAEGIAQGINEASISVGQLSTQTGIAEPQMKSLIATISNATFPQEEAMMYVKSLSQIGVESSNLGKSASDIDMINDAFGLGATKTNSLAQELSVLGVDMNNVSSSFNALAYANANTVGGMENYFTFLKRYDAQFKELGLNVDQASVLIAAATKKFGGGRSAVSGLNNALKEANGDTRKLEEALGMVPGSLENASQLTAQYDGQLQSLADEEAEHKTIIDQLNAVWEDMALQLDFIIAPLGSAIGLLGQLGDTALSINSLITLKDTIKQSEMLGGAWESLNGKATALKGYVGTLKTGLINVGKSAKESALHFLTLSKNVLLSGVNALKSAGMWVVNTAKTIATTIATKALTIAQAALNFVMSLNPITLVVMAIIALIAVLTYLYFTNEDVRNAINNLGQSLLSLGQWIYTGVIGALETVKNALIGFIQYIIGFGVNLLTNIGLTITNIINRIIGFLVWWYTLPSKIAITFINIIARALGFGSNFVQRITSAGSRAVNNFLSYIRQLPGKLAGELNNMLSLVGRWAATLPQKFWEAGVNAVKNFLNALGIHSPGTMQRMLLWEVSEMGNQVPAKASKLLTNINRLGKDIVDEFGNPRLDYSINDKLGNVSLTGVSDNAYEGYVGNQTINLNLEIGSVDNEKRVQEIVDVIRKELSWDNKTAGRTV